jgi:hypothetical protein
LENSKTLVDVQSGRGTGLDGYFVGGLHIGAMSGVQISPGGAKNQQMCLQTGRSCIGAAATIAAVAVHDAFFVGAICHASPAGEIPLS